MRNKKIFYFDEEKEAEKVILNGFPNGLIDYSKMYLIAKYFREKFGYGEIRLERELIRFCKSQDKNFNPVVEAEAIKKWIKTAMEYGLRKTESIFISLKEISFIKSIENPRDRKILFMTLSLAKVLKQKSARKNKKNIKESMHYYIHYSNFLDIIRLSGFSNISETSLADIFYQYKQYFTFYNPEKELIRLEYADPTPKSWKKISDLDRLSEHYETLFGKNKFFCSECGKEFIRNANNQKVCSDCGIKIKKEQSKQRKIKWRNKQKRNAADLLYN